MVRFSTAFVVTALVSVLVTACATKRSPANAPRPQVSDPGELLPIDQLKPSFVARQKITGRYGSHDIAFDAVVQRQGTEFLVLALTPFGSRAAIVRQRGLDAEIEKFIARDLPFPPKFILLDVQRVFFQGLTAPPLPDGWHTETRNVETVRELWRDGRLLRREFRHRHDKDRGAICVEYEGGATPGARPPTIVLTNEWFGYRLKITTSEYQEL